MLLKYKRRKTEISVVQPWSYACPSVFRVIVQFLSWFLVVPALCVLVRFSAFSISGAEDKCLGNQLWEKQEGFGVRCIDNTAKHRAHQIVLIRNVFDCYWKKYFASSDPHHGIQFIPSDILSGKSFGILSGSLFDILSGILSGICSGILSGIPSGMSCDIRAGILSGRSSDILSGILSGRSSDILPGMSIWHSICHIFRHSIAHLLTFYLAYLVTFELAFYLADLLTFYLADLLTFYLACLSGILSVISSDILSHIFWHSIWHILWHSSWHSIWQIFWHSVWHIYLAFHLACLLTFYLAYLLTFDLAFSLAFYMALFLAVEVRLWSGEAHGAQNLAGWGPAMLRISRLEVRRGPLRSRAGRGGPARPTAIESWQLRTGEAHCNQELTDEVRRGGGGGGRAGHLT